MQKIYIAFVCVLTLMLGACVTGSSGQRVYYWERPNTGVVWFARDHNECLSNADMWPYEWPGLPIGFGTPPEKELRFDNNSDSGIWAQFIPFKGAQPVYVNSEKGDWSMSYREYEQCMVDRKYTMRRPYKQDKQVFYQ